MEAPQLTAAEARRLDIETEGRGRDRIRWRTDPVGFVRERFREEPSADQIAVLESVRDNRRTFAKAGNGVGKTKLASWVTAWWMECFEAREVVTTAPSDRQVKDLLWKEIRVAHANAKPPLRGRILPREARWEIAHDHVAVGKTSDAEEGIKGSHSTGGLLVIMDEGPGCPDFAYTATNTMLTGAADRLLTIGNPTVTSGPFFDAFHSQAGTNALLTLSVRTHPNIVAQLAELGMTWEQFRDAPAGQTRLPDDLPVIIPGAVSIWKVESDKATLGGPGSPGWAAVIEGEFPSAGDRGLVDLAWLARARTGASASPVGLPSRLSVPQGRWAGLDVARFGQDRSVLVTMDGQEVTGIDSWQGFELSHTAGKALAAIRDGYVLCFDEGGLGAAITSHLKEQGIKMGTQAHPVNAGSKPSDPEHYPKMRDQLWGDAADLLRAGVVSLEQLEEHVYRQLVGELTAVQYDLDSASRKKIEGKEALRKRLGRSPDIADAYNLACHRPHVVTWELLIA